MICFTARGVCLIEWADLGGDLIPDHAIDVHFAHAGERVRNLTISTRTRLYTASEG